MSTMDDTPYQAEVVKSKPPIPDQFIARQHNQDFYIWKKHKDDKTLNEIYEFFEKWDSPQEIFVHRYAPLVMGAFSTLSAVYVNYHFRETLVLLNYTRVSSYAIMFLAPGVTAMVLHYIFVTRQILKDNRKIANCPVCLQIKGAALQTISSIGYPLILVPFICYPVAKRLNNYSVPALTLKNRWPVFQFTKEMFRPIRGPLWAMVGFQAVLGMGMTMYAQYNYSLVVRPKLDKLKTLYPPTDPRSLQNNSSIYVTDQLQ